MPDNEERIYEITINGETKIQQDLTQEDIDSCSRSSFVVGETIDNRYGNLAGTDSENIKSTDGLFVEHCGGLEFLQGIEVSWNNIDPKNPDNLCVMPYASQGSYSNRGSNCCVQSSGFSERTSEAGEVSRLHYLLDKPHNPPDGSPALVSDNGVAYYVRGDLHREDGPAVIPVEGKILQLYVDGRSTQFDKPAYFQHGKLHRVGGSATVEHYSTKYMLFGTLHRSDGPADIDHGGSMKHYRFGFLHNDNGPAEYSDSEYSYNRWLFYGMQHNLNGAAIISGGQSKQYYILGSALTKEEWEFARKHPTVITMVENTRKNMELMYAKFVEAEQCGS